MDKVAVLLSSYNGEQFIREQIKSIFDQSYKDIELFVRDDGSSDSTIEIVKSLQLEHKNLHLLTGENLGPARSFLYLLDYAYKYDESFAYFAFSDQDDFWLENKINVAVDHLKSANDSEYRLYLANLFVTDAKLNIILKSNEKLLSFDEQMLKNNFAGCTIVLNRKLAGVVNSYRPEYLEMHDSWITRICGFVGGSIYADENAYMYYRQHGNNYVGRTTGIIEDAKRKIATIKKNEHVASRTSRELLKGYSEIADKNRLQLVSMLAKGDKRGLLKHYKRCKFSIRNHRLFFVLNLLLGRL
ncbi:MAG: glycosyltransferase [Sphaerochaetaceae bacterium]|nr:glycosyltransferase [Sphaerochaetaceae bacterium]